MYTNSAQRFIFDWETQHSNTQNVDSNYKFWYSLNGQYWNGCQVTSRSKSIVDVWFLHLEDPCSPAHYAKNTKGLKFLMMRVIWKTLLGSQLFFQLRQSSHRREKCWRRNGESHRCPYLGHPPNLQGVSITD